MNAVAVADAATVSASLSQSASHTQPGAVQVARFEQQLQLPQQFYQSPLDSSGMSGNWRVMMQDVSRIDEQYRIDTASLESPDDQASAMFAGRGANDPARAEVAFEQGMAKLARMSYTMMNISLVTSAERLAGENMRSLYQIA